MFVQTFIDNAWLDPITNEIGKSLVFAVSQKHAAKLTQLLNVYADKKWPNKYKSDFAVQVTSNVMNSQQMTVDFSNDKLLGYSQFRKDNDVLMDYKTSKVRELLAAMTLLTGMDFLNIDKTQLFGNGLCYTLTT